MRLPLPLLLPLPLPLLLPLLLTLAATASACVAPPAGPPPAAPPAASTAVPGPAQPSPAATTAPAVPTASAPAPSGGVTTEAFPDALSSYALVATSLPVGEPYTLPAGPAHAPLTWRLAARDQNRATLTGRTLTPSEPGGLTLEVRSADGRVAWVHHAVVRPTDRDRYSFAPYGHPAGAAFPRPVVARDLATWQRLFAAWWSWDGQRTLAQAPDMPPPHLPPPVSTGAPAPSPGSTAVPLAGPSDPPAPPPAPTAIAFPSRHVLLVNVEAPGGRTVRPVVTHVEGTVVHLAVPQVYLAAPAVPQHSPAPGEPVPDRSHERPLNGWAFDVPALPPGVSVRLAPFPEMPGTRAVPAEAELP